jgi:hypothetical protein
MQQQLLPEQDTRVPSLLEVKFSAGEGTAMVSWGQDKQQI